LSRILLADGARVQSIKASQLSTLTYASFQGQLRAAASYFRARIERPPPANRLGAIFARALDVAKIGSSQ
jgi:hypothetical protein